MVSFENKRVIGMDDSVLKKDCVNKIFDNGEEIAKAFAKGRECRPFYSALFDIEGTFVERMLLVLIGAYSGLPHATIPSVYWVDLEDIRKISRMDTYNFNTTIQALQEKGLICFDTTKLRVQTTCLPEALYVSRLVSEIHERGMGE